MTDTRPTLLLTRPAPAAQRFLADLRSVGVDLPCVISPLQRIETLPHDVDLRAYPDLVFTSENGVAALAADLTGHRAWAVGPRTAQAARAAGCEVVTADGDAAALVGLLVARAPAGPILHVRGRHARGEVAARLRAAGLAADEAVVYDQVSQPLSAAARDILSRPGRVFVPLFSPRSAALLSAEIGQSVADLAVFAISPATAEAWTRPAPVYLAKEKTAAGVADQIRRASPG